MTYQKKTKQKTRRALSTRVRLAFGLSLFAASVVLAGQLLGLVPNVNKATMQSRKLQTETLAITGSSVAETTAGLRSYHRTLQHTIARNPQIRSIGLRNLRSNALQFDSGDHQKLWKASDSARSNDEFMFVPIFKDGKEIAQLEVCYQPLISAKSFLTSPAFRLAFFVLVITFLFFYWMLSRTLKQLDPRGAVPKRVREAFNTMAEGLLILDRNGQIMMANDKFGSLVGIDSGDLLATSVDQLSWKLPEGKLPWETAKEGQSSISDSILQITDANGDERTFMVSAAPVLGNGGNARGVIVTFDDITLLERQKVELVEARKAADDANEAKSNFLSRMSHEIRTPMNAIIGYTDILQRGGVEANEQVRYLTTIQSSGEHLLELINDILDLSKVEAGQMRLERREVAIVPVLANVVETLKMKASEKNLYLDLEIDGRIPSKVETDDTRLRQVLINTIGNAIKFTSDGGVKLVATLAEVESGPMLQFDIIDTGIGMSPKALQTIFDPFTQADDSVTRRFGGTGLGLAISKQLSEALGGGIKVQSQEQVGTCFTITIDPGEIGTDVRWVTNQSLASESENHTARTETEIRFNRGHLLIVDDGKANRDLAAVMLKRLGLTFDFATNGRESLEQISKTKYDVVLMDMNMPVMDGMTAVGHIRRSGLSMPIVALTALAVESERQKCLDAGCSSFLTKPIRMETLVATLAEFLDYKEVKLPRSNSKPVTLKPAADSVTTPPNVPAELIVECSETAVNLTHPDRQPIPANFVAEFPLPTVAKSTLPEDEEFNSIICEFADMLPEKLEEIQKTLEVGSFEEIKKFGHWLVGSAGTVGLEPFVAPAREIENMVTFDHRRLENLIDHLSMLCDRIEVPQKC